MESRQRLDGMAPSRPWPLRVTLGLQLTARRCRSSRSVTSSLPSQVPERRTGVTSTSEPMTIDSLSTCTTVPNRNGGAGRQAVNRHGLRCRSHAGASFRHFEGSEDVTDRDERHRRAVSRVRA